MATFEPPTAVFTDEQRNAINTQDRALALVAGAGSGKTTVLVQRYLRLLARGIEPQAILAVTFTTDAADQLRERILHGLAEASAKLREAVQATPYIGTIHSFCYGVLDQYGSQLGLGAIRGILTPYQMAVTFDQAYEVWLETLPEERLRLFLRGFSAGELRQTVRALFEGRFLCAAAAPDGPDAELLGGLLAASQSLWRDLEARFFHQGLYSFDDLENLALKILENSDAVAARLQAQFQYLLIDEFQDTSQLQWRILQKLVGSDWRKLFVVGDPKQSIYSFRHADFRLFARVAETLRAQGGEQQALTVCFRSRPALLAEINQLAQAVFLGAETPFEPLTAGRAADASRPTLTVTHYPGSMRAMLPAAEKACVLRSVQGLLAQGTPPGSIALLFRVSDRLPDYYAALQQLGIPAVGKRASHLFESYEVRAVLDYLKAVANPLDDFHLAAFLRSAHLGLTQAELWEMSQQPGETLYEKGLAMRLPRVAWFYSLIENGEFGVAECLRALFQNSPADAPGAPVYEILAPLSAPGLNVAEAVLQIESWERENLLFSEARSPIDSHGAVQLLTVHAAKGLEFPHVFLVDCLRQMPHRTVPVRLHPEHPPGLRFRQDGEPVESPAYERLQEIIDRDQREEARRILYVALTRAADSLTIFLPTERSLIPKGSWGMALAEALEGQLRPVAFT